MDEARFLYEASLQVPEITLDQISGREYWKKVLKSTLPGGSLDEIFLLGGRYCICLTGTPGNGKRTLALACAGSAAAQGSTFLRITEGMLSGLEEKELPSAVRVLFSNRTEQHCVMMFETFGRKAYWRAIASEYARVPDDARLTVLIIEDDPGKIYSEGIPDMMQCLIEAPETQDRKLFFEDAKKNALPRRRDSLGSKTPSHKWMAEQTEGFTYRELNQLIRMLRMQLKQRALAEFRSDTAALIEALRGERFYIDSDMFTNAKERIISARKASLSAAAVYRNGQTAVLPAEAGAAQSIPGMQPGMADIIKLLGETQTTATPPFMGGLGTDLFGGLGGVTAPDDGLTEDQRAEKELEAMLDLPPDPRAN